MKVLARLSFAGVVLAYAEVLLGSWTRIQGAGMTCPDYPLCHGKVIPPFAGGTIWEWTHRLVAIALCIAVVSILLIVWRRRDAALQHARIVATIAFALLCLQVALGAATVFLSNSPFSVVWHWGTAMALVAALAAVALFVTQTSRSRRVQSSSSLAAFLASASLVAFITMCIGAYVSSSGAGLACTSLPGCAGNVVVYRDGQLVQMLHRIAAAATLLGTVAGVVFSWAQPASARVRAWAASALVLVFVQIILGLLNVALRLPLELREAHSANAALIFVTLVCATTCAALDRSSLPETARA